MPTPTNTPDPSNRPRLFRLPLAAASLLGVAVIAGITLHTSATPAMAPFPAPQPTAVALVDLAKLMNGLHELNALNDANKIENEKLQDRLTEINNQIEADTKELKDVIPQDAYKRRSEKMAELFQLNANLKASHEVFQTLIDTRKGNIIHQLYDKITKAIDDFAQREGYDLVLLDDRGMVLPPLDTALINQVQTIIENKRILYARDGMDITNRLITVMNTQFDAGSPPTTSTPAPAPAPAPTPSTATPPPKPGAPK